MPKGQVSLPDGRTVSTVSPEYKTYLKENPDARRAAPRSKTKTAAPPSRPAAPPPPPPEAEVLSGFEPSTDTVGTPKAKSGKMPSATIKTKRQELHEDQGDLAELIAQGYAAVAGVTGFDGWKIAKDEAEAIARPAGRILARHKHLDRAVRQVADPLALISAILIPTGIRLALYREHLGHLARTKNVTPPGVTPGPPPGPPPPAAVREAGVDEKPARVIDPLAQAAMMRLHTLP